MPGIHYFLRGLSMLNERGIRRYVVMPVLFNLLLFGVLTWVLVDQLSLLSSWLQAVLVDWLEWLLWILWLLAALLWLVVYGYCFSIISNSIAAPFYGLLAEKVQAKATGQTLDTPLTWPALVSMVKRTLIRELQKLAYLLPRLLAVIAVTLPLYFVPVIGVLTPFIWFAWSAWSLALENVDYAADNNSIGFSDMRSQMSKDRATHFAFGGAAALACAIPLVNLLAVPAAVAGGTLLWLERHPQSGSTIADVFRHSQK